MTGPFLTLNTTVWWSLNTSGRAAANYNPPPYAPGQGCVPRPLPSPPPPPLVHMFNTRGHAPRAWSRPGAADQSHHALACVCSPGIPPAGTTWQNSFSPIVAPHKISDTLLVRPSPRATSANGCRSRAGRFGACAVVGQIYHNGHETATCTPNYDGVVCCPPTRIKTPFFFGVPSRL